MKKYLIIILAIIVMIGVVIGCVYWYNSSVNPVIENPDILVNSGDAEITSGEEIKKDEPIFTLENYPKVDASLAIHPLVDSIASNFLGLEESELNFEYTKTRTSEVYRNLIDRKVDVIFAAEISKEDEEYAKQKGVELNIIPATSSAFVFIVNEENPVENLTFEQIQKIYTGEITNWGELGGESGEIIAYQRPTGSGSQTAMLSLVMKEKEIMTPPLTQIEQEMGGLIDAIAEYDNSKNAIGYSYFYYVNTMYKKDTIKMVSVDGVMPTIETIKNGTYPIYTNAFIVTRANEENENVEKWVDAVLSERGSQIIEDAGYVPVEKELEISNTETTNNISEEVYIDAIKDLYYNNKLPDGTEFEDFKYVDNYNMSENQFAIYDVDMDGKEELIIALLHHPMAAMRTIIYDYDANTNKFREQLTEFNWINFYNNGVIEAMWSHNQGVAGDALWPYTLYNYNKESDSYDVIAEVDAWDKSFSDKSYIAETFPTEIDKDGNGIVYYIRNSGAEEYISYDFKEYNEWREQYITGETSKITFQYLNFTEENIEKLK